MEFFNPFNGVNANTGPEKVRYNLVKTTDNNNHTVYQLKQQINNGEQVKVGYDVLLTTNEIIVNLGESNEMTLEELLNSLINRIEELEKKP